MIVGSHDIGTVVRAAQTAVPLGALHDRAAICASHVPLKMGTFADASEEYNRQSMLNAVLFQSAHEGVDLIHLGVISIQCFASESFLTSKMSFFCMYIVG